MRNIFLLLIALFTSVISVQSADRYALYVEGEFGYNVKIQHCGGVELKAVMPINPHYEMQVIGEFFTPNAYTVGTTLRPKFQLPVGEMFVDGTLFYQALLASRRQNFIGAASLGYRMDYVSAQIGLFTQGMWNMDGENAGPQNANCKLFNVLYKVQVNVRPGSSPWNLCFGMADYTDCVYNTDWEPILYTCVNYDLPLAAGSSAINKSVPVNERHWRLFAEMQCKHTGFFTQQPMAFNSLCIGVGFAYMF